MPVSNDEFDDFERRKRKKEFDDYKGKQFFTGCGNVIFGILIVALGGLFYGCVQFFSQNQTPTQSPSQQESGVNRN